MHTDPSDGSDQPHALARSEPDPHGQAALLLVESLFHSLLEKNLMSQADLLGVIDSASTVKLELVDPDVEHYETAAASMSLLDRIGKSISAYR